ncbi:MAG: methyltransferase family protein [Chloroflexota bacterium]
MSEVIAWSTALVSMVWLAETVSSQRRRHDRIEVKKPRSWMQPWPNVALVLFVIFCVAALAFDLGTLQTEEAAVLQIPGLLLAIAATVLSARAKVEMGEQFADEVQVWTGQLLVTRGLFSLVRHPIYMSVVAMWLGAGMGLGSWLLIVIDLAVMAPTFYLRARREERLILDHFGQRYREYRAQVPMLLPWPRPSGQAEAAPTTEVTEQPNVAEQE